MNGCNCDCYDGDHAPSCAIYVQASDNNVLTNPHDFLGDLDVPEYDLVERPGERLTERPWKPVPLLPWPVFLILIVGSVALTCAFAAVVGALS